MASSSKGQQSFFLYFLLVVFSFLSLYHGWSNSKEISIDASELQDAGFEPTISSFASSRHTFDTELERSRMSATPRRHDDFRNYGGTTERIVVDVLTMASNERLEYMDTQKATWAHHPSVRNFFNVTEDLVEDSSACQQLQLDSVIAVTKFCHRPPYKPSWLMNRFLKYYARESWIKTKSNPAGWLCAQKRFPLGLANTILGYSSRGEALPDYLLMVDDDTYYNLDLFHDTLIHRNPLEPFVGAGCRVTNGRPDAEDMVVFPFGGFGLTFSKGTLERFLQPIRADCGSEWQELVLSKIQKNLIGERDLFRDGMNLAELMQRLALMEPYQNVSGWTRGYCFHGDWIMAIFTQLYRLHSEYYMETLMDSEITVNEDAQVQRTGSCGNLRGNCTRSDLVCHYQRPEDMRRFILQ
eukprot:CAMPEP_0176003704 /NCGR_PEP_ID=MMETSP0120_2-20121206/1313_1 /TAXON_ID=160619 /ORGANISM="Kryptoperidinium foliaceum, Strain CCMP 1326" /LENGTH=410 /DNA_ID=CAMNT_0017336359 /DNA_START=106 /DNA_END=1338 /DNA_ORIENTATION=-